MKSCGVRLREFRVARDLSLREAARQLHVVHPALREWEEDRQTPAPAYRDAIEVWTNGEILASSWPASPREREIAERAGAVKPCTTDDSGEHPAIKSDTDAA